MLHPFVCASGLAPASPDRIFGRVPYQKQQWQRRPLRLLSFADSFLVFGFEFMNYELVSVGILYHRHVATRRFKGLGGKSYALTSQRVNHLVEIFHLKRSTGSLI